MTKSDVYFSNISVKVFHFNDIFMFVVTRCDYDLMCLLISVDKLLTIQSSVEALVCLVH